MKTRILYNVCTQSLSDALDALIAEENIVLFVTRTTEFYYPNKSGNGFADYLVGFTKRKR